MCFQRIEHKEGEVEDMGWLKKREHRVRKKMEEIRGERLEGEGVKCRNAQVGETRRLR